MGRMGEENKCWGTMPERLVAAKGDAAVAAAALLEQVSEREIARMTSGSRHWLRELVDGLVGHYNFVPYPAADIPRLGIPGVRFADGPRGVVVGHATAFPCSMARGASFDPALEARVGDAIGREVTAQGANFYGGVCVNVLRHPAWGRAQETYGEDPLLLGEMGVALTRSSGNHAATCVKHFACNSMENSRFRVDVRVEEADLRDIYLPHFKRCVDAGVDCVMTAYNKVNGEWCGHHHHLIEDILRGEWGFDGFVMSDFILGIRDIAAALNGGLDVEMPFRWRGTQLSKALATGEVSAETVRTAAFRTLKSMFAACGRVQGIQSPKASVCCEAHLALARETARRSFVLLKNDAVDNAPALPLTSVKRLAVIGRLAALPNTGDLGSSKVRSTRVITAAEGFEALAPAHSVHLALSLSDNIARAERAAADADAAVVVVGNTWRDEGEYVFCYGGDRKTLRLPARHEHLIHAVARVCPRTVAVLVGGSVFVCDSWLHSVPAAMMAWYTGAQGGPALAEVVLGEYAPGGRLPCTWPVREDQLPPFSRDATEFSYGPLHGYRHFLARHDTPAFWFGHGLGYAPVAWGMPVWRDDGGGARIEIPLRNAAAFPQREVVQVYLNLALGSHAEPLPTLAGFGSIEVAANGEALAHITIDEALLRRAPKDAPLYVGRNAGELIPIRRQ